ncbi:MAG TPA: polyhydroxyalkanoate depolymerase [Alphaproteobacteria bacterium]
MIYEAYQAHTDIMEPVQLMAGAAAAFFGDPLFADRWSGFSEKVSGRDVVAAWDLISRARLSHKRPHYGIDRVTIGNREVAIEEEVIDSTPFCTLLHWKKDVAATQPRVLVVAPMSGHFATLLRGTVRTLLPEQDVYITDWHNARDVPLSDGSFGFDDFVDHLIRFTEILGQGVHVVAICQPSVAALAAVAIMAEDANPAQPASLTLMAGPVDTRVNPTQVNRLATSRPIEWFKYNLISRVPLRHSGALRRVYPGFLQLLGFMTMNLERHAKSHIEMYNLTVKGDLEKAEAIRTFYEEYFAVMDLPAEFFLETVQRVFQQHELPLAKLTWRGRRVDPGAIRRTALLTVEGEKDDICAIGQTLAAQDLCSGIRPYKKRHYMQMGVGHYGVFNGRRWNNEIYPVLRDVIHMNG